MMCRIIKYVLVFLSLTLLLYLLWPFGPKSITAFSPLPDSAKSSLSGDTVEVPNITAFFSNHYRHFVTPYYRKEYQYFTKLPFSPLRLNHPPEDAFVVVKDQTQSTYLEEFTYPLKGTLFVNGLEPFDEETKEERYEGSTYFVENMTNYETKVTLRFYPTPIWLGIIVWLGINLSFLLLVKMAKKIMT